MFTKVEAVPPAVMPLLTENSSLSLRSPNGDLGESSEFGLLVNFGRAPAFVGQEFFQPFHARRELSAFGIGGDVKHVIDPSATCSEPFHLGIADEFSTD